MFSVSFTVMLEEDGCKEHLNRHGAEKMLNDQTRVKVLVVASPHGGSL